MNSKNRPTMKHTNTLSQTPLKKAFALRGCAAKGFFDIQRSIQLGLLAERAKKILSAPLGEIKLR